MKSLSFYHRIKQLVYFSSVILLMCSCNLNRSKQVNQQSSGNYFQVDVDFSPSGADIYLDGKNIGQTPLNTNLEIESPQEFHLLEIKKENFIPYVQRFSIPPTNEIAFNGTLAHLVLTETINDTGGFPGWSGENFCYFSSIAKQLFCQENETYLPIYSFSLSPDWIIYTKDGIYWEEKNGTTISITFYNNENKESIEITRGWFAADLNTQNQSLCLFGYTQNENQNLSEQFQVSIFNPEKEKRSINFSQAPQGIIPEGCSVSSDGQWLITDSSGLFELWQQNASTFAWTRSMEDWLQADFAPFENSTIAFINSSGELNILNLVENQITFIDREIVSFVWENENNKIIYVKHTLESSDSLWEYDLASKQKRILADSELINGSMVNLAISQQDTALAYTNHYQHIYKLILFE